MPRAPRDNAKGSPAANPRVEEMPEFMKADVGRGTEEFKPEDLPWMGDEGDLDSDQLVSHLGHDPLSPLEYVLLAIIDAHAQKPAPQPKSKDAPKRSPGKGREMTRGARLEMAIAALTGSILRKRGMDEKDDYELLLQIAWEYHCRFWAANRTPPEIDPIIRARVERLPPQDPRRLAITSSVVSRLRRKFLKNKDLLLARAAEQRNLRRMDRLRELETILLRMKSIGIPIDLSVLRPPIVERDAKPR
jgi:hypothetical protein